MGECEVCWSGRSGVAAHPLELGLGDPDQLVHPPVGQELWVPGNRESKSETEYADKTKLTVWSKKVY